MNRQQLQVKQFHVAFKVPTQDRPKFPATDRCKLRVELIREELREFERAIADNDLVAVADALADLLYVVNGAGVEFGIDLARIFEEVHASNMSKLDNQGRAILRADGKVLKSLNYRPPRIRELIKILSNKRGKL